MKKFLTALVAYTNAAGSGPLTDTITGKFWLNAAPTGTAMPYCLITIAGGTTNHKYGSAAPSFEESVIQFTVRAAAANTALDLVENATTGLCAKMDGTVLTISSGQHFQMMRLGPPIPEPQDPSENEQGQDTFGWIVQYAVASTS